MINRHIELVDAIPDLVNEYKVFHSPFSKGKTAGLVFSSENALYTPAVFHSQHHREGIVNIVVTPSSCSYAQNLGCGVEIIKNKRDHYAT